MDSSRPTAVILKPDHSEKEALLDPSAACHSITQNQKKVLIYK